MYSFEIVGGGRRIYSERVARVGNLYKLCTDFFPLHIVQKLENWSNVSRRAFYTVQSGTVERGRFVLPRSSHFPLNSRTPPAYVSFR